MCILNDIEQVVKLRQQMGLLRLWKVVENNNSIGIWGDTRKPPYSFQIGKNVAVNYVRTAGHVRCQGAFHCTFTRKAARRYRKFRDTNGLKIIEVLARTADIVSVGIDIYADVHSISVSEMGIKSLNHQR